MSDEMNLSDFEGITMGAQKSRCCLIFDEFNRVREDVMPDAYQMFKDRVFNKQMGLTLTFNPNY